MMKTRILLFALMCSATVSFAQQDAQFTQYMYNTININPAYAGSKEATSIFVLHRSQWIGVDGAPVTSAISINAPIKDSNIGIGVSLLNDKIGPVQENTLSVDLSYTIKTSDAFKLSFGVKTTANLFNLDATLLNPVFANDPNFQNFNKFTPNIGAGVYLHSDKAYVGFSVPNFIESQSYDDNQVAINKKKINYYFIAGYVFDMSASVKFKPAVLTKLVQGAPMQVDLSGNFLINDKFTAGIAYRWSGAVSTLVGFQASDSWFIGYGYDLESTQLANYNSGTHELFLRYELFKKIEKTEDPKFF
jgi:type IX secretion system PorP/SprF family membrane protein